MYHKRPKRKTEKVRQAYFSPSGGPRPRMTKGMGVDRGRGKKEEKEGEELDEESQTNELNTEGYEP